MVTKTKTMSLSLTLLLFILVSTVSVTSTLENLSPAAENKGYWCVANKKATDEQLQANIDWCCSYEGGFRDCTQINPGGVCYEPNTLTSHASFVMNDYYRNHGSIEEACEFNHTGQIISGDPSYRRCRYS